MNEARPVPLPASRASLFVDAGEMGRRIAEYDWATSPLGPIEQWPEALVNAVSLLLPVGAEIVLFWGADYVALYNDAYAPTIGDKHPGALGCPARECWSEMWHDLEPLLAHVRATGETFVAKDRPFSIDRAGYLEDVFFDVSYSAVRDADGSVGGVLCIVSETTERVAAQSALAISRESLTLATEAAEIGTWDYAATTDSLRWSDRAKAMFGISPHVAVTLDDFYAGLHPEDLAATTNAFAAALDPARRAAYDVEYRTIGAEDGVVRWIAARGRGVFEEDRCVRAIGTTVDITRRRAIDDELRESEERFRQLADTAPALIWLADAEGRVVFTNRWFQSFLGIGGEDMRDGGWARIIPAEDREGVARRRAEAWTAHEAFGGEMRVVDTDGRERWVHAEARPRFHAGRFEGFVGCAVDVTDSHLAADALEDGIATRTAELAEANRLLTEQIGERERVEETLQQMQRLEAVGQLTSGVAHDFNNLLTVVLGNVEMLQRLAANGGAFTDRATQRLEHIRAAAERGATLTSQLLAFARRAKLEAKAIDLNDAVAGMRGLLASSLGGQIAIETRLADALWPALVDPTQIELIILNLAINARDAMERGGKLTIETANITLGEPERAEEPAAGDYVMVAVADKGSGMTPEVLAKAFEPFFTTKAVGKGSGLGLAQVYGFVKQSGGGVRIDTAVGEGTVVRVYLPRSEHAGIEEAVAMPGPAAEVPVDRRTILVLDDDDAVRVVTADSLREAGWRVVEAVDGASGLEALRAEPGIALVVTDFAMPEMNGAEFAGHARTRRPDMPFVFVTGYADHAALADFGDDAILQKPYRVEDLLARVRKALLPAA